MENTVPTIEQAPQVPEEGFIPVVSEVEGTETLGIPETPVETAAPAITDKSVLIQEEIAQTSGSAEDNDAIATKQLSPQYGFPYTTGSNSGMPEMVRDKQAGVRPV